MPDPLSACPSCGDQQGFEFWVRVEMAGLWGKEESESTGLAEAPLTVKCVACGYRVSRARAEGKEVEYGP